VAFVMFGLGTWATRRRSCWKLLEGTQGGGWNVQRIQYGGLIQKFHLGVHPAPVFRFGQLLLNAKRSRFIMWREDGLVIKIGDGEDRERVAFEIVRRMS
jgi:hypothetical protein